MKHLAEILGWYGTIAIVVAYALISFSILEPTDLAYQILNATGAIGIVIVSFHKRAYQPGILNVVWALVAFLAIINIVLK